MNSFFGGALMVSFVTLAAVPAIAQSTSFQDEFQDDSFALAQTQLELLAAVEESLYSTNIEVVGRSYRKLFFQIGALDRYLVTYGNAATQSCTNQPLNGAELEIYCTLFSTRPLLFQLLAIADARQLQLGNTETNLLNLAGGDPLLSPSLISQEVWRSEQNTFDVVVIDNAKPLQNQGDLIRPAIAPLPATIQAIATQKTALLALNRNFSDGLQLLDSDLFATTTARFHYVPVADEYEWHAEFLAQPNTGISRLMPRAAYAEDDTASRLQLSLKEQFPFPNLGETKPLPNLPLLYENNEITFIPEDFNLGLIADLGAIDFSELDILDNPITQYNSPITFAGLQEEQRRLLFQKDGRSPHSTPLHSAPLQLNHTYLVRLIQYDFAAEILTGEPLPRHRLKELNLLLEPNSYDVLIAIKPVKEWLDGGYTLLWQVVDQSAAPELIDLADYIAIDSPV